MPAPSATCELYIDGVRVPDTADQYDAGIVTALDGLSLTWGRDGQNEQPGPASLSMNFLDPAGNNDILDVLHVGSDVAVWAEGEIPDDDDLNDWGPNTFDPQQATWTGVPDGAPPTRSVQAVGSEFVELSIIDEQLVIETTATKIAIVPPRPFSPTAELPDAWDDIPKYEVGQTWKLTVAIKAPAGYSYQVEPRFYSAPYASATMFGSGAYPVKRVGTGDYQTVEWMLSMSSLASSGWVTIGVTTPNGSRSGRRWADQTTTWADQTTTWADPIWDSRIYIDNLAAYPPGDAETSRRVLVFSGQVSDVLVTPDGDGITTAITATAMDEGAKLGNTVIGDEPWSVETSLTRARRIALLAGITLYPRIRIDDPLDDLQLSYRDVDAQPAFALLQDLAQSIGGVLWVATHATIGPYLWIENPATRAAVQQLVETGGIITITGASRDVSAISACDLLEDGVSWRQDTADVITVVAVTWLEQGTDSGKPTTTERTVTVTDTAGVATYGTRRLSISTELIAETDATAMANRILAQARAVAWRLDGLTMDTAVLAQAAEQADPDDDPLSVDDTTRQVALLDLLDGTTRMGAAVTLVDMPAYAPRGATSSVYVEGGKYTYDAGYWVLRLTTTPSAGQGASVTWAQLADTHPTWSWQQFGDIAWVDLYGVTA